jgi:ribosomal protein L37AE/L43A
MAVMRHKSRRVSAAPFPHTCEVCREEPAKTLVADFIFACDSCAKRIATALWQDHQERVVVGENFSSDRETNRWVY